jgi:hypothetical protein
MEEQPQKKAIIIDTNFVVQFHNTLEQIVEQLSDNYSVYISQVSVDERIAQRVREMRKLYKELEDKKNSECKVYSRITFTKTIEEAEDAFRNGIQSSFDRVFSERIIPFSTSEDNFARVLKRANDKTAPFNNADGASDKGFKDTLIWLSVLDYFKVNGENEVVFMTDDSIFSKSSVELATEFAEYTGKTIDFKTNATYKELTKEKKEQAEPSPIEPEKQEPLPDLSLLREEINEVFGSLVWIESEDYFGETRWERAFEIHSKADETYAKMFFEGLRDKVLSHMFESKVPASEMFSVNGYEINDLESIPMDRFEKVLKLYENVKKNYPQYMDSFYKAFAQRTNENYKQKPIISGFTDINSDDLPF